MSEKKIARVFVKKTSFTPEDKDVYIGGPTIFVDKNQYDEIHISCTFTWDKERAQAIAYKWDEYGTVKIGGPAFDDPGGEFTPGMYVRKGITITSRGCPNSCSFCFVPKREGKLRELEVKPGNIIQDNNILACSKKHLEKVGEMLKTQKRIEFKGGLETRLITPEIADWLRSFSIKTLWIACDTPNSIDSAKKAIRILQGAGFTRRHIYCYCLIGKDMEEEKNRLDEILQAGAFPFAQLYRDQNNIIVYSKEYKQFAREWMRPAIIRTKIR